MPWWGWLLVAVVGLFLLARFALASWRKKIRTEYVAYLREKFTDLEVVSAGEDRLRLKSSSFGEVDAYLHNLYHQAAQAGTTPEARRPVFERFTGALQDHAKSMEPLSLAADGDKILARLAPPPFMAGLPAGVGLPQRPLGNTGLVVLYVVDRPNSVLYLTDKHLEELGLGAEAVHERALANLRRLFPADAIRKAAASAGMTMFKVGDGHDATRLLAVPEQLEEGEVLAAMIPDQDTLILGPPPKDGSWAAYRKLCVPGGGKPLLDRPLRVTREGVELA